MDQKQLEQAVEKRRTFAIISHPDAGKTTITEQLLLFGGVVRSAGTVKAKKTGNFAKSDWMEIEKKRGISVTSSVMQFDYDDKRVVILDTPGHEDFSEDTYRTLMAVDSAVMVIDSAKGIEPQTKKLFQICKMRGIPIFTFINKLDRDGREPLDLTAELEEVLGIGQSEWEKALKEFMIDSIIELNFIAVKMKGNHSLNWTKTVKSRVIIRLNKRASIVRYWRKLNLSKERAVNLMKKRLKKGS